MAGQYILQGCGARRGLSLKAETQRSPWELVLPRPLRKRKDSCLSESPPTEATHTGSQKPSSEDICLGRQPKSSPGHLYDHDTLRVRVSQPQPPMGFGSSQPQTSSGSAGSAERPSHGSRATWVSEAANDIESISQAHMRHIQGHQGDVRSCREGDFSLRQNATRLPTAINHGLLLF